MKFLITIIILGCTMIMASAQIGNPPVKAPFEKIDT
jgi:hypothetical protein